MGTFPILPCFLIAFFDLRFVQIDFAVKNEKSGKEKRDYEDPKVLKIYYGE